MMSYTVCMNLPYDYLPAVLYAIEQVSLGDPKSMACDKANISVATFDRYIKSNPELQELYNEADVRGSDALADALVNIDNHKRFGRTDPKMAKVISENIKWLLSKRKSKQYGERVQVEHNVTMDKAIIAALTAGRKRVSSLPAPEHVIDVVQVEDGSYRSFTDAELEGIPEDARQWL